MGQFEEFIDSGKAIDPKEIAQSGLRPLDSSDVYLVNMDPLITVHYWSLDNGGWNAFSPTVGQTCTGSDVNACCVPSTSRHVTWVNTNQEYTLHIAYKKAGGSPKSAKTTFKATGPQKYTVIRPGSLGG